jgi:hypothetical protein
MSMSSVGGGHAHGKSNHEHGTAIPLTATLQPEIASMNERISVIYNL